MTADEFEDRVARLEEHLVSPTAEEEHHAPRARDFKPSIRSCYFK